MLVNGNCFTIVNGSSRIVQRTPSLYLNKQPEDGILIGLSEDIGTKEVTVLLLFCYCYYC